MPPPIPLIIIMEFRIECHTPNLQNIICAYFQHFNFNLIFSFRFAILLSKAGDFMKQRILLVEDDSFLRDGLTEVLQGEGYEVISANNCIKARELIKFFSFNLIMLDVMLPDGNGLELCTEIRAAGNNVPVLFLTACDDEIQIVRGLDAGADDYVTKPFKLRELLSESVRCCEEQPPQRSITATIFRLILSICRYKKTAKIFL